MRWEKYGWQFGRITDIVTNATPRVFKKFNYRIIWADGSKGPAKLCVENYGHGSDARYKATTHGQSYLAQSLQCERAAATCAVR